MKIGFTGTRQGMTANQRSAVEARLSQLIGAVSFRHGDCVGADADAHEIALRLGLTIILHPSNLFTQRAHCQGASFVYPEMPPLDRNRVIVDNINLLLACPSGAESLRSGTWATIRYARKQAVNVEIFWP